MKLAFRFHYIHDNGLFTRVLNRISERSTLSLSLYKEQMHYSIEVSGGQVALEVLAEQISSMIPQSLFLRAYSVEAIEEKNRVDSFSFLTQEKSAFNIPYCPECQERVIENSNPFVPCRVCGFSDISLCFEELTTFTGLTADSSEIFFTQLADNLLKMGEIALPTYNGLRRFSLLNPNIQEDEGVLFCNPMHISEKFLITQGELNALLMVEKPTVRLKPKLKFRLQYALDEPFYPVFFADDKVTLALCIVLKNRGIDAIFSNQIPILRVAASLDDYLIVNSGRDMLPWRHRFALKRAVFCEYAGVQAYGDEHGLVLNDKLDLRDKPFISYVSNQEKSRASNAIHFEPAHGALRSVVLEHPLEKQALCGIYLSRENPSQIFSFSPKIGYTPLVQFRDEAFSQPKYILKAIAKMDEGGIRLIKHFKKRFPKLYAKIEQHHFSRHTEISGITKFWAMAAVFLGLYEGDDMHKASQSLEATALEFAGKSGPRIDYKIISKAQGYQLDLRVAIRSAISFKLAGLDPYLLSFGFVDSLADFIALRAEDADANIGIDAVVLGGNLFENRQLWMRTYNAIGTNYPLYKNERLSIDDINVAMGAITLGSE